MTYTPTHISLVDLISSPTPRSEERIFSVLYDEFRLSDRALALVLCANSVWRMAHDRLAYFLDILETLSARPPGPEGADGLLRQIHETVIAMKEDLGERSSLHHSMSSRSTNSDAKMTVESIEAARSDLASTVGIDDTSSVRPSTPTALGFIDAIKLAALGLENTEPEFAGDAQKKTHTSDKSVLLPAPSHHSDLHRGSHRQISKSEHSGNSSSDFEPQESHGSTIATDGSGSLSSSQTGSSEGLKISRRIKYFNKCFPAYRKLYTYETQPRSFLRAKNYNSFCSALSPDILHMALVNSSKYEIFEIPEIYNDKPRLKFSGETGFHKGDCWAAMNNMWLVTASYDGNIMVVSLKDGSLLFRRNLKHQITALDVSSEGSYIGVAIAKTIPGAVKGPKQPLIYLICPSIMISPTSAFEHPDVVSFSSPYEDKIQTLSFNDSETAIICSTKVENRVFIVSLADYREPRILMRSRRNQSNLDDGMGFHEERQPEGITGTRFLPNIRYVLLCSYESNSPPVVLDTKLTVSRGRSPTGKVAQYLQPSGQQQAVVIRFDKMGSAIQTCAVSPRGNGAAFVDYSGAVYAVNLPTNSTETRKIAVVFNVAAGSSMRTAPAFRFSPDGTTLIAVDRKGDMYIADFGAGHPQQPGIMKTKVLS